MRAAGAHACAEEARAAGAPRQLGEAQRAAAAAADGARAMHAAAPLPAAAAAVAPPPPPPRYTYVYEDDDEAEDDAAAADSFKQRGVCDASNASVSAATLHAERLRRERAAAAGAWGLAVASGVGTAAVAFGVNLVRQPAGCTLAHAPRRASSSFLSRLSQRTTAAPLRRRSCWRRASWPPCCARRPPRCRAPSSCACARARAPLCSTQNASQKRVTDDAALSRTHDGTRAATRW
jgi:hypothetical protein